MIELPNCPPIKDGAPRYIFYGTDQSPILGGPQNRILRLGDRWGLDVQTYPAKYAEQGMAYLSRLIRGLKDVVRVSFPEPGVQRTGFGAPVVSSLAAGQTLPVSGLAPGVLIKEGKFLSIYIGERCFLHQVVETVTASGAGTATLTIQPMLRWQPPVGSVIDFDAKIEGYVQGNEQSWQTSRSKYLPFNFSIVEAD